MQDPLKPSGNLASTPVTQLDVDKTQEVNQKGRKFNRSVSVVKASPQEGLRARAKNFLPRPLYKFLVSLVSSNNKAQYQLGKDISQARDASTKAWQSLGDYHALPQADQDAKHVFELQLDCRKKDLKLDQLQGWGDSPVSEEKREVIKLLEKCVNSPEDKQAIKAYEEACEELKETEYAYETLRLKRTTLKKEEKLLTPIWEAAKPINVRLSLEASAQLDPPKLTEEERQQEATILERSGKAYDRLKEIKKELAFLETKIRQQDNSLVDVERAREALYLYENSGKTKGKGAN